MDLTMYCRRPYGIAYCAKAPGPALPGVRQKQYRSLAGSGRSPLEDVRSMEGLESVRVRSSHIGNSLVQGLGGHVVPHSRALQGGAPCRGAKRHLWTRELSSSPTTCVTRCLSPSCASSTVSRARPPTSGSTAICIRDLPASKSVHDGPCIRPMRRHPRSSPPISTHIDDIPQRETSCILETT